MAEFITVPFSTGEFIIFRRLAFASIVHLLSMGRPSAIFGGIAQIIIHSIKRQPKGAFSHVGKKIIEAIPAIANRYSSRAVIFERLSSWISASCSHFYPASICRRLKAICSGVTVFIFQTSTRTGKAACKTILVNDFCFAAITSTDPPAFAVLIINGQPNYKEAFKA